MLKEKQQSGLRKENGKTAIVDLVPNRTGAGFLPLPPPARGFAY